MKVRPRIPDNSLFCADACTAKVQTAISAPMVMFFSDIFSSASRQFVATQVFVQHGRAFPIPCLPQQLSVSLPIMTQLHYGSSTLLDAESINYVDRANQPPVSDGVRPPIPAFPMAGERRGVG